MASQWYTDFLATLERVFAPNPSKADVDALKAHLIETDATDAEQNAAIKALVEKLATSVPA